MVPTVAFPPVTPSTDQVTDVFELPETVAVNCWVVLMAMAAEAGAITTLTIEDGFTVALAVVVTEFSATDIAVIVKVAVFSTLVGAV
jgi:hypothetical protein